MRGVVCLLVVLFRTRADLPLVVAANRDERLDRPATAMAVLRGRDPRVLGGRDEQAKGTWFAVNDRGVIAGLTNRPSPVGAQPAGRRSRGELPLALAGDGPAAEAVEGFRHAFRPQDFNPAWILAGDRRSLFALDMTGTGPPPVRALDPGVHIVENQPPGTETPKVAHIRTLLAGAEGLEADALVARLEAVLADHHAPAGPASAACVHAEEYGTRWSGVVTVPAGAGAPPRLRYAPGPPCRHPFVDAAW